MVQPMAMSDLVRSYKMTNVTFVEVVNPMTQEMTVHAIIDRGNDEFTSMPKSVYDEMIAQQEAAKTLL